MVKRILQSLLLTLLLTGCMNIDQRILDDIQLSTAAGYEYIEDDTLEITTVFPSFQTDKSIKSETITDSSTLSKEVRDKHSLQSEKPFVSGKVEVTLYEWKTAEKGINNLLDTLQRDPSIGSNVFLVVVDGSPKELLSKQYGNPDNGIYLSNLIEQNIETGLIHKTNLHQFLYKLYAEGIDPALPVIKQEDGQVKLTAVGLFENDKLVGQIEEEQFFIFKILLERKGNKDSYSLKLNEDEEISIYNIGSERKYDIQKPLTNSEIIINVKLKSSILEYQNGTLKNEKITYLEKEIKKLIEQESLEMIQQFQEKGIDPLGIGEEVRTRTRNWDQKKWKELYPDLKITVNVEVNLLEKGVVE
ncbi:Ger(x)C family spore germination protein [Paucisalibacillus sp. EB02]|uniref:Ger(x)C family spore germination protein n=1 Tax=Paucisalibacillus sp. EB02 TaxID=1347087 RepID=UPI0004B2C62C|nr:Ger(x)C family spore germination protein [Paucisalibacillus sp. EB02]